MSYTCESDLDEVRSDQDVLFLKVYENNKWDPEIQGWLIDNAGNVKVFSSSENGNFEWNQIRENEYISENMVYANSLQTHQTVFRISFSELYKYFSLVDQALKGVLSESVNDSGNEGTINYFALKYYPDLRSYKTILIDSKGKYYIENTSNEAVKIRDWLFQIEREIETRALH